MQIFGLGWVIVQGIIDPIGLATPRVLAGGVGCFDVGTVISCAVCVLNDFYSEGAGRITDRHVATATVCAGGPVGRGLLIEVIAAVHREGVSCLISDSIFEIKIQVVGGVFDAAFADLVANVRKAEAFAKKALGELENKNYTTEYKYVEMFGKEDYVYTLNKGEELKTEMNAIYMEFSNWLGSWEM